MAPYFALQVIGKMQGDHNRVWIDRGLADWSSGYFLTGTRIDNVCIWRLTPQKSGYTVNSSAGELVVGGLINAGNQKSESVILPHAKLVKVRIAQLVAPII